FQEARLGRVPSSGEVKAVVHGMVDGVLKSRHSLLALTMIKSYDEYLFNHSVNVGILSIALGEHLGHTGEALHDLGVGAFLHDLGKVNWPDEIYRKARDLSEEEWQIVKSHPEEGVKLIFRMEAISLVSLRPVLEHHMRHDRSGYPSRPRTTRSTPSGSSCRPPTSMTPSPRPAPTRPPWSPRGPSPA
ncbi:MAG: HD domain-containing phosphohydrolase, partial [candidate division NC10 bacterium]